MLQSHPPGLKLADMSSTKKIINSAILIRTNQYRINPCHSHSMVAGGFPEMS